MSYSHSFDDSASYRDGKWLPLGDLSWGVTDLGTTQGAILVERARTFGGKLIAIEENLARMEEGANQLGIPWPPRNTPLGELAWELIEKNRSLVDREGDVGIVLLLSPGDPAIDRRPFEPTLMAHVCPLPFPQLAEWYDHGAALHIASTRNIPSSCWAPSIKTRSRLQYYLADRRLGPTPFYSLDGQPLSYRPPPHSVAILLSVRGFVTETSISNLLLVGRDGVLRSPPLADILSGTSLSVVCDLARSIGLNIEFIDLPPQALVESREILMTGSTGCLWSAVSVNGIPIGDGHPGQLAKQLQRLWQEKIGFSFVDQALQRR